VSQTTAEVIILALNGIGAGILVFVSGVVQKLMNQMDELEFKRFMNMLDRAAMSDPIAVTVATLPILAAIAYWIAFGFAHWWFTAGIIVWGVGSAITKVVNMPVYQWLADPNNTNPQELSSKRRKLQFGNTLRAWTTLGSVVLMACQFGPLEVAATVAASIILSVPFMWLSRRYIPGATRAVAA
jgi:hypothetical protein